MTLVTTITYHQLWQDALRQNTLPAIANPQEKTDENQSCCITAPLSITAIDELREPSQNLVITYISPDIAIADLLEEGKELKEALSTWKKQTLELLSFHKKQRREIFLLNLEQLTQLTTQEVKNLETIGWPITHSVPNVPSSVCRVIAAQALAQDHELNELATLLFVSSYAFSSKPLAIDLPDTLNQWRNSKRTIDDNNKERERVRENEQLIVEQLFKVQEQLEDAHEAEQLLMKQLLSTQEQLEDYYVKCQKAEKSSDTLSSNYKRLMSKAKTYKSKLNMLSRETAIKQAKITQLSHELKGVHSSLLWKATKPLRAIKNKLSGNSKMRDIKENAELIKKSNFFDENWYLEMNADVRDSGVDAAEHYLLHGAFEGRNPSKYFDSSWYLSQNSDVADSVLNPLIHFLKYGQDEKRSPSSERVKKNTANK